MITAIPTNRLTLVVGTANNGPDWTPSSVLHVETVALMQAAIGRRDVERIVLDSSVTVDEFLHILADLSQDAAGDVLLVRADHTAFLSAVSRGGDRVFYALTPQDLYFYFETHGLTGGLMAYAMSA